MQAYSANGSLPEVATDAIVVATDRGNSGIGNSSEAASMISAFLTAIPDGNFSQSTFRNEEAASPGSQRRRATPTDPDGVSVSYTYSEGCPKFINPLHKANPLFMKPGFLTNLLVVGVWKALIGVEKFMFFRIPDALKHSHGFAQGALTVQGGYVASG